MLCATNAWEFGSVRSDCQIRCGEGLGVSLAHPFGIRWLGTRGSALLFLMFLFRRGGPRCPAAPMIKWGDGGQSSGNNPAGRDTRFLCIRGSLEYSGMPGQMVRNVAFASSRTTSLPSTQRLGNIPLPRYKFTKHCRHKGSGSSAPRNSVYTKEFTPCMQRTRAFLLNRSASANKQIIVWQGS